MATSTIEALSKRLVTRSANSASEKIPANGNKDFYISFSAFNSPGKPLALASVKLTGSYVSVQAIYYAWLDMENNRVNVGVKNNNNAERSFVLTAQVLFLE